MADIEYTHANGSDMLRWSGDLPPLQIARALIYLLPVKGRLDALSEAVAFIEEAEALGNPTLELSRPTDEPAASAFESGWCGICRGVRIGLDPARDSNA